MKDKKSSKPVKKSTLKKSDKWKGCFFYKNGNCSIMDSVSESLGLSKKCVPSSSCILGLEIAETFSRLKTNEEFSLSEDISRTVGIGPLANYF